MSTLLKIFVFISILCTIGCNNNTLNPTENLTGESSEFSMADTIGKISSGKVTMEEISRSWPGSTPQILVSRKWFNNIKKFNWNTVNFSTMLTYNVKSIAQGKYIWRYSPISNVVYVFINGNWSPKGGYVGGVDDMSAVKLGDSEHCYLISSFTQELYYSNGNSNFTPVVGLAGIGFRRIDVFEYNGVIMAYATGVNGHVYFIQFRDAIYCYNVYISSEAENLKDVAFSKDGAGNTLTFGIGSDDKLYYSVTQDDFRKYPVSITNCRFVDVDRDARIWIIKNTGSVYVWNSYDFQKVASNLAWDIATESTF